MDKNETRKYIEHRLKVAGWRNDPQFSNEALSMIYDYSDGIPRRVNTLCDRLLLLSAMEEIHDIDENIVAQLVEELDEEIHFNKQAEHTDSAGSQPGVSRASKPGLSGSADIEGRLRRLENIADKAQDLVKAILAKD
jgi:hypothetical protein